MTSRTRSEAVSVAFLVLVGVCGAARAGIIHRYSFADGTAKDSVGKVDGVLHGTAKIDGGKLVLNNDGKTSADDDLAYLDFPTPIIPASGSVSIEEWFTARPNGKWGRLFDFGDKDGDQGKAYFAFMVRTDEDVARASITATDYTSETDAKTPPVDDGKPHMLAVVIDGKTNKMRVFVDGKSSGPAEDIGDNTLDSVTPTYSTIGKSVFTTDSGLSGSVDEFRVFSNPLKREQIEADFAAGPKAEPAEASK